MEAAHLPWRPLGELFVARGLITEAELEEALAEQLVTGRRLGEVLVDRGLVSGPDLTSILMEQLGVEVAKEDGFGSGLWAEIQRRHRRERGAEGEELSDWLAAEPTAVEEPTVVELRAGRERPPAERGEQDGDAAEPEPEVASWDAAGPEPEVARCDTAQPEPDVLAWDGPAPEPERAAWDDPGPEPAPSAEEGAPLPPFEEPPCEPPACADGPPERAFSSGFGGDLEPEPHADELQSALPLLPAPAADEVVRGEIEAARRQLAALEELLADATAALAALAAEASDEPRLFRTP